MELPIKNGDRILIVAPHPDDETIGCGGLMLKYGAQCEILLLTDGRKGYDSAVPTDEDRLALQRAAELRRAAEIAGVDTIHMLGIPDGTLKQHVDVMRTFDITPYDLIFVPNRLERHRDHAPVLQIVEKMRRVQNAKARIYEYEVWSPIPAPTDVLDLSDIMGRKLEMVRQYQSQIRFLDYEAMTEALNRYRGAGRKSRYAEAYSSVPQLSTAKQLFRRLPLPVRNALYAIVRKLR